VLRAHFAVFLNTQKPALTITLLVLICYTLAPQSAVLKLCITGENMQDIVLFVQHHWALNLILAIVVLALIIVEFINQKTSPRQLSPGQTTLLINHGNAAIADLRSTDVYKNGHIINSISLPLPELKEKTGKLQKFKSQPIVLVCASGVESLRASQILLTQGFDVRILAGGIRAWIDADMPLVKD
jgi:rhodanese-related sulfurtransferase